MHAIRLTNEARARAAGAGAGACAPAESSRCSGFAPRPPLDAGMALQPPARPRSRLVPGADHSRVFGERTLMSKTGELPRGRDSRADPVIRPIHQTFVAKRLTQRACSRIRAVHRVEEHSVHPDLVGSPP